MFKDKNLKLAILNYTESLQEKYQYGWDKDYDQFCLKNFGKIIKDNEYGGQPSKEIESFFLNLEIPKEELESITHITFDADNSVYTYIIQDVVGWFEECFTVHSLDGIENCINLKSISFGSITTNVNLQPLTQLKFLESISLEWYNAVNYKALLHIPNLKKLEVCNPTCFGKTNKEELSKIIKELEQKGIFVSNTSGKKLELNI